MEQDSSCGAPESRATSIPLHRRRVWTSTEENMLLKAIAAIIKDGFKCPNGFKNGYLVALEKEMRKLIPNCDLRAEPHINSRITTWKKNQASLQTMMGISGFSWDNTTHQIIVEDEKVWEEYAKTDEWGRKMRNKRYPMYNQWCELFGSDRARGDKAEDCNAADRTQLQEETSEEAAVNIDESPTVNIDESPTAQSNASSSGKEKRGKRKAVEANTEQIVNLMGKFCDTTSQRLNEVAQNIGYEIKMSKKREMIREELGKVPGLDAENRIAVAKILVSNDKDLELFFSLPPEEKPLMVGMVINGRL